MKELLEIDKLFNKKKQKLDQHAFSLVRWKNGLWSISVTDDWHKWIEQGLYEENYLYKTPEDACIAFLSFVKKNKINIKKLQS